MFCVFLIRNLRNRKRQGIASLPFSVRKEPGLPNPYPLGKVDREVTGRFALTLNRADIAYPELVPFPLKIKLETVLPAYP